MGRTAASANRQRNARAMAADREAAFEQMNGQLKKKCRKIEKMITDTREQNLRFYHGLGSEVHDVRADPEKYGIDGMTQLERALSTQTRTLRKARQFFEDYDSELLEELISLVHEDTGFRLHWGHVTYLLGLNTKKQKSDWAKRAVRNLWDPPALHAQIKDRFPDRGRGGGRPHKLPPTVHLQIRQMMEVARNFINKRRLWNDPDENVFENVMQEPPDELVELDKENLEATKSYLETIVREATDMIQQVDECIVRVEQVFEARTKAAEEAAEREADAGRAHRSINLNEGGSTKTRRRRSQTAAS